MTLINFVHLVFLRDSQSQHIGFSESEEKKNRQIAIWNSVKQNVSEGENWQERENWNWDILIWFKQLNFKHGIQRLFVLVAFFFYLLIVLEFCYMNISGFTIIILFIANYMWHKYTNYAWHKCTNYTWHEYTNYVWYKYTNYMWYKYTNYKLHKCTNYTWHKLQVAQIHKLHLAQIHKLHMAQIHKLHVAQIHDLHVAQTTLTTHGNIPCKDSRKGGQ